MGGRKFRGAGGAKEKWGAGAHWDKVESFEKGRFGVEHYADDVKRGEDGYRHEVTFDLIHGQHPHSRQDNNTYARVTWPGASKPECVDFSGTRLRTRVEVHEYNYLKQSGITGNEIKALCQCTIYFWDRPVYGFHTREAGRALIRAATLIDQIAEHPVDWRKVENDVYTDLVGRLILYRNTPAVVTHYFPDQGAFVAKSMHASKKFPVPGHVEKDRRDSYYSTGEDGRHTVKEDIFSTDVWWFREKVERAPRKAKGK